MKSKAKCKILLALWLTIFFSILFFFPLQASQSDDAGLRQQLESLDLTGLQKAVRESGNESLRSLDLSQLIWDAAQGKVSLTPDVIMEAAVSSLFGDIKRLGALTVSIVVIGVLSAFFKALSESFKSVQVSQLGFFVSYLMIMTAIISSFTLCAGIAQNMIGEIAGIMLAAQPVIATLLLMGGSVSKAYAMSPVILYAGTFFTQIISVYLGPVILMAAGISIINYLSEKDYLKNFSELIKKGVSWGLKASATLFMAIAGLQKISAPLMDNAAAKTARFAVSAVPVVGSTLSTAMDAVFYWAGAVRGGVMAALIIVLVMACAAPVVEIAAFVLIYKITAALLQPICDERLVNAVDSAGSYGGILMGACLTVGVMFLFMAMAALSL